MVEVGPSTDDVDNGMEDVRTEADEMDSGVDSDVTSNPVRNVQDNLRALSVVSALTTISFTSYVVPTHQNCLAANFNLDPRSPGGRRCSRVVTSLLPLLTVLFLSAFLLYNITVNARAVAIVTKHRQALARFQDISGLLGALQYERHTTLLLAATQPQYDNHTMYKTLLTDSYTLTNNTLVGLSGQWNLLDLTALGSSALVYLSHVCQVRQQGDVMQAEKFYTDSVEILIEAANGVSVCGDNNNGDNGDSDGGNDASGRPTVTVQCYRLPLAMQLQETFTKAISYLLLYSSQQDNVSLVPLRQVTLLLSTSRALTDECAGACNATVYSVLIALAQTYLAANDTLTSSPTSVATLHNMYSVMTSEVSDQVDGALGSVYEAACDTALSSLSVSLIADIFLLVLHLPILLLALKNACLTTHNVHKLASLFTQRTTELQQEKKRTEVLLTQMLPKSVYKALQQGVGPIAEEYDEVTVMFSDIAQFNDIVFASSPLHIVNLLNTVYNLIDDILECYDVYKVETVGSTYMMVSGVPKRNQLRHAAEIANLALDIISKTRDFPIPNLPDRRLLLRLGAHSGPCVTAVVGNKLPRYCLFGDTVNTASRMQSNGLPCQIQISRATKDCLDTFDCFETEYRSQIEIKGKGAMECYWLLSRRTPPPTKSKLLAVPPPR